MIKNTKKSNPQDVVIYYMVTKTVDKVDAEKMIWTIVHYVQTNEIYFRYNPRFLSNVLVFGIVGLQTDQDTLHKMLGAELEDIGCKLDILKDAPVKTNTLMK